MKKKQPYLLGEAVKLTMGSTIVGRLPGNENIKTSAQSAFNVTSIGLPLISMNYVLKETKKLKKLQP